MSLILEALRRSEAERRRGLPPSLLGGGDAPRARASSPWPMAVAGLLIGLALAGAVAWWFVHRADGPPEAQPAADAASPRPAVGPMDTPRAPIGASPDVAIEPVPAAAYGPSTAPATPPSRAAIAAPVATAPPAPTASPAATAPPPSEVRAAPPALASSGPPPPTATAPLPSPPASTDTAASASGLGPRDGDLPWSALATGTGEALPAPRISMHVYADEPARRFAIVDGQRRREGDLLHPGMPLLEIRRDGLRVGWQGRVLWVPR